MTAKDMDPPNSSGTSEGLVFWGGGCSPYVLARGTPEEVREEVKRRINELAPEAALSLRDAQHPG